MAVEEEWTEQAYFAKISEASSDGKRIVLRLMRNIKAVVSPTAAHGYGSKSVPNLRRKFCK